jgi:hypothetical protein
MHCLSLDGGLKNMHYIGKEGRKAGRREEGKEGRREEGREGGRKGGRERGKKGILRLLHPSTSKNDPF